MINNDPATDRALEILRRELCFHQERKDESQESINSLVRAIKILEEHYGGEQ